MMTNKKPRTLDNRHLLMVMMTNKEPRTLDNRHLHVVHSAEMLQCGCHVCRERRERLVHVRAACVWESCVPMWELRVHVSCVPMWELRAHVWAAGPCESRTVVAHHAGAPGGRSHRPGQGKRYVGILAGPDRPFFPPFCINVESKCFKLFPQVISRCHQRRADSSSRWSVG